MKLDARRTALLVAANTALAPFAIDAYLPAMPALAEAVDASVHHTELSISFFLLGFALGQLTGGPLSDRFGRRPVLLSGLVIFLIASLLITQVNTLTELLGLRFVQALGGGACVVNSAAIVRDCFSGREAAKVMSTMAMIMMLAPLAAPAVGSGLLYLADWWLIFVFLAVYAAFLLWLMGTRLPETRPADAPMASARQVLRNYASVLRHREAMGYVLSVATTFAGMFAFITASPFLYITHYGISPAIYPVVFGANVVVMAASNRLNIRLLRRRSPQQNMRLGMAVQLAVAVGLIGLVATGLDSPYTVVPLIMVFMGMVGLITPNAMSSMLEHFSHMSATATALLGSIQFTCGSLAGVIVSAFEIDSAWPMVLTMLVVSLAGNIALRRLAGHALGAPSPARSGDSGGRSEAEQTGAS